MNVEFDARFTVSGPNREALEIAAREQAREILGQEPLDLLVSASPSIRTTEGKIVEWEADVSAR